MSDYTPPQAARRLGVSRMTIIRWIHAGRLTATTTRQGYKTRYWISRVEVERIQQELADQQEPCAD